MRLRLVSAFWRPSLAFLRIPHDSRAVSPSVSSDQESHVDKICGLKFTIRGLELISGQGVVYRRRA